MSISLESVAIGGFFLLLAGFLAGACFAKPDREDLDVLDRYYRNQGR